MTELLTDLLQFFKDKREFERKAIHSTAEADYWIGRIEDRMTEAQKAYSYLQKIKQRQAEDKAKGQIGCDFLDAMILDFYTEHEQLLERLLLNEIQNS